MILRVNRSQLDLLREESRKCFPIEACALLFGSMTDREAVVKKIVIAPNVLRSTVRFGIEPQTLAKAIAQANEEGLEIIGLFHSHPALATPSGVDLQYMRFWSDAIWLILSSTGGSMAAFQMIRGEAREVAIEVEDA